MLAFVAAVFTIASTAIGIECMNSCPDYKEKKKSNKSFLIFMLVLAILIVTFDLGKLALKMTAKAETGGMVG
jgi:hypothetical protein